MSLEAAKLLFESELISTIEQMGKKGPLRDACEYALMSGGKRLRPLIVLMTARALGSLDVMPSAISVELFHTASLIADDLPSMDNDALRRGRPSLHKVYGETTALLASYTLIAGGYGGIHRNSERMKNNPLFAASSDLRAVCCLESATRCAGIDGATQGQFLDLYPPDSSLETVREIIYKKTVTLFEISFVFGWLFGGGEIERLSEVKRCAYHLGMAFQTADDLLDALQDSLRKNSVSMVAACGYEKTKMIFEEEMSSFVSCLKGLGLLNQDFEKIVSWLLNYGAMKSHA